MSAADPAWDTARAERAQLTADIGELRTALGDLRFALAQSNAELSHTQTAMGALCVEAHLAGRADLIDAAVARVRRIPAC